MTQIDVALRILPASKVRASNTGFRVSEPLPFPAYRADTHSAANPRRTAVWIATEMKFAREVTVMPNQFTPVVTAISRMIHTARSTPGSSVSRATAIST
jgi:hypothetical protein